MAGEPRLCLSTSSPRRRRRSPPSSPSSRWRADSTGPSSQARGFYHESRLLLERALPGHVCLVDERDTCALLRAIEELRPSAIFLDSLSNTKWMPVPELT